MGPQRKTVNEGVGRPSPFTVQTIERFDFGGHSPSDMLIEDMLDRAAGYAVAQLLWQVGRFNGRYQELPASGEVRLPPFAGQE